MSVVYTSSTNKVKSYVHYYSTDSNVVSSISTPETTVGAYSRQEVTFATQEMTGNVTIRAATMFPSALSETVMTAAAKKILANTSTDSLKAVINPGDYVPSQFSTVQNFTNSPLFYQSSLSGSGAFGVVTTAGLTKGFYNLPGNIQGFLFSRQPVVLGSILVVSMEFQSTNVSTGNNKDFNMHLSPNSGSRLSLGTEFSVMRMAYDSLNVTFTTSPSTFTTLHKFELKLVNQNTLTGTIYNVANNYNVVESKTVSVSTKSRSWAGNLEIRNQAGTGTYIIGNIVL